MSDGVGADGVPCPRTTKQIPLFPLHTVLSPGLALPLHVFEDRYRVMVRHCLDTSSPFGVVLIHEGSEVAPRDGSSQELSIASVGTLAVIREASRHADGRWELLAVGSERFQIERVRTDDEPYLVADVEPLDDRVGDAGAAAVLVHKVSRRFVRYLRLLQPLDGEALAPIDVRVEVEVAGTADTGDGRPDADDEAATWPAGATRDGVPDHGRSSLRIPDDPSQLSFLLTGILQVDPFHKQALLEAPTAETRLRDIDRLLDRELALLRLRLAPFGADRRMFGSSDS